MKTTLNKIRKHSPCAGGWAKLLKHLGKTQADDEPVSIVTILDGNGFDDALWCLCAVEGHDREIRLYAVWCARQVQHLMTDKRSIAALDVAERFARGEATKKELVAARAAARATAGAARAAAGATAGAADAAAWDAARAAAGAAAWAADAAAMDAAAAAAGAAAWAAARAAAWATAGAAAVRAAQEVELRRICGEQMMTASLYNCGHCGRPQIVGAPCLCWRQGNEMISIEKLGVAISDFIGQHGLMWSDALVEAWQEAEANYVNEMTNAFNQGQPKEKNT